MTTATQRQVRWTNSRGVVTEGRFLARHTDFACPMNEIVYDGRTAMLKDDEFEFVDDCGLTTDRVQVWNDSTMLTAQMPVEKARQFVRDGRAKVICEQAIQLV